MAALFAFISISPMPENLARRRSVLLDAWRESPLYSERESAALGWTEALTLFPRAWPDDVYRALQAPLTEEERVMITC
jgi:alkylhydroperoxidase family enzyme